MELPRIEFILDDADDKAKGIIAISLVNEPAILSDFVTFNKENNDKIVKFVKLKAEHGYEQVVLGPVLRPNLDIFRKTAGGVPYVGYFTAETIKELRNKFHKDLNNNNVTLEHENGDLDGIYMIESFIVDSDERLADVKAKGLTDVEIGAWVAAYKVESKDIFDKVLSGEINGFSMEGYLDRELVFKEVEVKEDKKEVKEEKLNNVKFEKIMNKLLDRLNVIVAEFAEQEGAVTTGEGEGEVTLERVNGMDGMMFDYGNVGEAVFTVTIAEDGTEEVMPAEEGEYELDDGRMLVVDAESMLVEVKDAVEPAPAEDAAAVLEAELTAIKAELAKAKVENEKLKATLLDKPVELAAAEEAKKLKHTKVDTSNMNQYEKMCNKLGIEPK